MKAGRSSWPLWLAGGFILLMLGLMAASPSASDGGYQAQIPEAVRP